MFLKYYIDSKIAKSVGLFISKNIININNYKVLTLRYNNIYKGLNITTRSCASLRKL